MRLDNMHILLGKGNVQARRFDPRLEVPHLIPVDVPVQLI
jgi:hypothetical protein